MNKKQKLAIATPLACIAFFLCNVGPHYMKEIGELIEDAFEQGLLSQCDVKTVEDARAYMRDLEVQDRLPKDFFNDFIRITAANREVLESGVINDSTVLTIPFGVEDPKKLLNRAAEILKFAPDNCYNDVVDVFKEAADQVELLPKGVSRDTHPLAVAAILEGQGRSRSGVKLS